MKIAFVSQPLDVVTPPSPNSIGIWTSEVARRLAEKNDVIIFAKARKNHQGKEQEGRLSYHFVPAVGNRTIRRISRHIPWAAIGNHPFFSSSLYHFEYALQLALQIRRERCDIVHIQNMSQFVPIIRAINPKVKIALHMHCEWLTQLDRKMIEKRIEKTDMIFGCSDYITRTIQRHFPAYTHICHTIYNGVDPHKFLEASPLQNRSTNQLLMVGRISPEKGVHTLIEAFIRAADENPLLKLDLVGSLGAIPIEYIVKISDDPTVQALDRFYQGNYYQTLQRIIPASLKDRINFTGFVGHEYLTRHYQKADILINPSLSESFGMSLIEAMACEIPVIATRVGGMVDVVENGRTGFLVEPENPAELALAITHLLANPALRSEMGIEGKKRVIGLFSWDIIASTLLNGYLELENSGKQDVHKKAMAPSL